MISYPEILAHVRIRKNVHAYQELELTSRLRSVIIINLEMISPPAIVECIEAKKTSWKMRMFVGTATMHLRRTGDCVVLVEDTVVSEGLDVDGKG